MKVALVLDKYMIGGGLINIYRLVKSLQRIEFGIFANEGNGISLFHGIKNVNLFYNYKYRNILNFNPDIIHFNHLKPLANFVFYDSLFRENKASIVFTAHGLHIHKYEFISNLTNKFKFYLRFNLEKYIYLKVNRIVAVSKNDMEWLKENYRLKNISYIPNGIDCDSLMKNTSNIDPKFVNLLKNNFIFFTIARFDFQKGYEILVNAINLVDKSLPSNVLFLFVGNGPEFKKIKKITRKLKLDKRILFLGEKTDNYLLWKYGNVFILPSRWEGLPTVLLEAGCHKKLVIASDTYGNNELIYNEETGLLFPVEDYKILAEKIKNAYKNYNKLSTLGLHLHDLIKSEYSIEKMVKSYENIYFHLI